MERHNTSGLFAAISIVLAAGLPVSAWGVQPAEGPVDPVAPKAVEPGPGGPKTYLLNFKDHPFDLVLDFFSRESGLPIIREVAAPQGTMTFLSGTGMTFDEALSVLNLNLRMHGVFLRREDNYLYLASLEDSFRKPTPVVGDRVPDNVTDDKILTITIPLSNAAAPLVADQIKPLVSPLGGVTAVPAQNMIVLVESAGQIRRIAEIIRAIDSERAVDSKFQLFKMKHADCAAVVEALKGLIGVRRQQIIINPDGSQRIVEEVDVSGVQMQPDPRTNSVIVVGPQSRIDVVEELIALVDVPESGMGEQQMMTFGLRTLTAEQAAAHLRSLFQAVPEGRKPTILPLADVGKVTVVGSQSLLVQARALLGEVDPGAGEERQSPSPERVARVVRLRHTSPAAVEQIAARLLTPRQQQVIRFAPSLDGRGVIVSGPPEDVDRFAEFIAGIDVAPDLEKQVRMVRLASSDPKGTIQQAEQLFSTTKREGEPSLTINFDDAARMLTLIGSAEQIARFEGLIQTVEANAVLRLEARTYEPKLRKPSELAAQLPRLVGPMLERRDGGPGTPPAFEGLDELNTLIVRAEAEQFGVIMPVIAQLDRERAGDSEFRVIRVRAGSPEAIRERALVLYAAQSRGVNPTDLGEPVVDVDEASGSLLVTARPAAMRIMAEAITQAQALTPPERTTRMVDVRNRKAEEIAGQLRELLATADPIDPSRAVPEPSIRVVERSNSLLVTAEAAQHALIGEFVSRLDQIEITKLPPLRLLQLRTADATSIANMLQHRYAMRPQADRAARPVDVSADAGSNTLLVSAHTEVFDEIKSFVENLNKEQREGPDRTTVLFPLKVAKAADVATAMDRLYPEPPMPRDRRGQPMPWLQKEKEVHVSADPSSNSLIIDAPSDRISSLQELAEKLDRVELPPVAQLRTYRIVGADLGAISRTLTALAGQGNLSAPAQPGKQAVRVVIETEPKSSTLIVAGDEVTFERVEQMLEDLSAVPVEKGLRVVPVANVDASDVRARALAIYDAQIASIPGALPVEVTIDESTNSLEVVADAEGMTRFMAIIDQLQRQAGPAREIRMIELRFAKAGEVVAFLRDMVESSASFRIGGGADPVFEPIEATNTLMVAAQPGHIPIIEQLVRTLDNEQSVERPPLRILRLRATDAGNLAQVLQQSYDRRPVEERVKKPVDVQADGATNTLVVSAHPDVLPEIEALVEDLNQTQAFNGEDREIRIFPLKVARAEELAQTIDQMFPEPPVPVDPRTRQPRYDLREPKEVVVRADRATNSLIVDAPGKRLAGFEQLVQSLDQHKLAADTELRTYRVERAELNAVVSTLRQLAQAGALGAAGQQQGVTIEVEPVSRTLVVSGPSEVFAHVERVLGQVDASPERPASTLRLYALKNARAERLQPLLEQLLAARLREEERAKGLRERELESLLEVAADKASNTLIVSGPTELQEVAEQLIRTLDVEAARIGSATIRVIPLTYADAVKTAASIQQALPGIELPSGGSVSVIAAPGSNALLVTGVEEDLAKVEELLRPLDERPAGDDVASAETFQLKFADAAQISKVVERLLTDQLENDPRLLAAQLRYYRGELPRRVGVRVEADVRTNALIVSGPAATIDLARAIIDRLDQEGGERTVATFLPTKADPAALAESVGRIAAASMTQGRIRLELVHEARTGSIVAIGSAEQVAQAVKLLAEFDERSVALPAADVAVFDLESAAATTVAGAVQTLLADRARWPEELRRAEEAGLAVASPVVNADATSNRLVISAPTVLMPLARDLIEAMDTPGQGSAVDVQVFRLAKGDAASIAQALTASLRAGAKPGQKQAVVTPEARSNSVLVAASPEQMAQAAALIDSMDAAVDVARAGVRTIFLRNARAEALAPIVEQLLTKPEGDQQMPDWVRWSRWANRGPGEDEPTIKVLAEPRLNAIVVSAPASILELAEQTVAALDVDGSRAAADRSVRVLTPANADASELAATLADLFADDADEGPPPVVRVDAASNSLIVRATGEQFARIEELVSTIDRATLAGTRELRLIRVDPSRADARDIAAAVKQLLERSGNVEVEVISAEELLRGDEDGASQGPGARRDGAPQGAGFLNGLTPAQSLAFVRAIAAMGGQPRAEQEPSGRVTIAVDPATNSLIVVGSTRLAERIAQLAGQLESQMPGEPTQVRIVTLPEGTPTNGIVQIVRETVAQVGQAGDKNTGGFTGRVAVAPDPSGQAVIVWANDTDFEVVGKLIASLSKSARATALTVKVYPLENVRADRAADSVADLVSPLPRGRQAQRLRAMDITVTGPDGRPVRAQVDPNLVSVSADPAGVSIIVAAPAEAFGLIDAFVSLIDQSPVNERLAIRRYELRNAQAMDLARTFESLFEAQRQGPGSTEMPRARFIADERTNAILVTASETQHAEVARLLETADTELAQDGLVTEIFTLEQASPQNIERVIEQIVVGRDRAKRERIQVSSDEGSRVVIVKAPPEEMEAVRQIIAQVDVAEVQGLPVRTVKLRRADASAVARSLKQFFDERARATSRGGRGNAARVAVVGDRRSGTLIVAAGDEDFAQVASMVEAFDEAAPAQAMQIKVVQLKNVRVSDVRDTLSDMQWELQAERMWGPQAEEGADKLYTQFNERTNSVVLIGTGDLMTTAERIVEAIDLPGSDQAKKVVRAVRAEHADLNALADVIEETFRSPDYYSWWGGEDPDGVTVEVDNARRMVLLVGPKPRVDEAVEYITQLDQAGAREGQQIESVTLRHAQADRAAQALNRFFLDRARSQGRRDDDVSVIGSTDGNVLIVSAKPEDMEIVRQLVTQIDQPELGDDRAIAVYVLRNAEPLEAAQTLRSMFPATRADERVIVTPQASTRSLIVSAPARLSEQVAQLVAQVDKAPGAEDITIRTVPLAAARAEDVAASLRTALPENLRVQITAIPRSNSIFLTGSAEAVALVEQQIQFLDKEPPRTLQVYKRIQLKHAMADDVWLTLTQMMRNRRATPTEPLANIDYTAADNTISVNATPDQMAQIETMIADLDVPAATDRTTEFVKLEYADAAQTAKALQVFYGRLAREARTPGARNTTIVPDPASNSLVISAGAAEWEGIRTLLKKLDTPAYDTSRQLVVLPLLHADAESVARALNDGFGAGIARQIEERARAEAERARSGTQGGNERERGFFEPTVLMQNDDTPTVSAEPLTNSLIVFATRRDLERIEAIVKQLDVPDILKLPEPRVIPLSAGKASTVANALREMFITRGGRSQNLRGVMIFGDDASNTIIVRANDEQFVQIEELARTIQASANQALPSPRVVRLRHAPAARLRQTLLGTFQQVAHAQGETLTIEIDRSANALVIGASDRLFRDIERVIADLDSPPPGEEGPGGEQLPTAGPGQDVIIVDLAHNSPQDIADILTGMGLTRPQSADRPGVVSEPVILMPLKSRTALAVVAGRADAEAVRRLIKALDAEPLGAQQHAEVVYLRLADAQRVVDSLRGMLDGVGLVDQPGPAAALAEQVRRLTIANPKWDRQAAQVDLAQPIRLVADPQTNSITVISTQGNVAALKEVVSMFDTLPIGDAVVVRIFPLKNAAAGRVRAVIDDLFRQGEALRRLPGTQRRGLPSTTTGQALAGEIAVSVDDRTNALVVAGREEAVALVEVILKDLDSDEVSSWVEPTIIQLKHADPVKMAQKLNSVLVAGLASTEEASALQRQVARLRIVQAGGDPAAASRIEADLFSPMSRLVITPEETLGALIVVGSSNNVRVVRELVSMLDVEAAAAGNEVRVYPMRFAAADRVAQIAGEVFRQREASGAMRAEDRLIISTDTRTNSLVVSTSPRSLAVLEGLLKTLDAETANLSVGVHVVPVPNADVMQLAPKIERLMRERLNAARRAGIPESPSDAISIEPEPASASLIVAASDENFQVISELVEALTSGQAVGGLKRTEVIPIERGQAAEVAQSIMELYVRQQTEHRGAGAVIVSANDRLNALVVTGTDADIDAVRTLAAQLSQGEVRTEQDIRRIELKTANALEVVNLLEQILAGRPIGGSRAPALERQAVRIRFLRDQVAESIEDRTGREPAEAEIDGAIRDQVRLTPDLRTNSVMVSAPPQLMRLIEAIIFDLDTTTAGNREIEVFQLRNADATAMGELLRDLFNLRQSGDDLVLLPTRPPMEEEPPPGMTGLGGTTVTPVPDQRQELAITVDPRTNSLLVSGTAEYLDLVRRVVQQLDTIEAAERERVVYHLKNAKAAEVAETLQNYFREELERVRGTLREDQLGSLTRQLEQEVTVVGDEKSNKLVLSASPRYIESVRAIIEELDAAPPQVVIQVLLAEVTLDSEDSWGTDIRVGPLGGDMTVIGSTPAGAAVTAALGLPQLSVSSGDFSVLIRSLQAKGRLEVLSRPEVTVNNNEDAFIQVGENIAIIDGVDTFESGRSQANVRREDVGIIMSVTPSISADGFVRMFIKPSITAVTARTTQISEDFSAPIISKREVETTVTVKDGQTVVIGGLIQTSDEERKTKVPGLGDIPLFGEIFRTRVNRKVKTELLVILTPRVIPGTKPQDVARQKNLSDRRIEEVTASERIREMLRHAVDEAVEDLPDDPARRVNPSAPPSPGPQGPVQPETPRERAHVDERPAPEPRSKPSGWFSGAGNER